MTLYVKQLTHGVKQLVDRHIEPPAGDQAEEDQPELRRAGRRGETALEPAPDVERRPRGEAQEGRSRHRLPCSLLSGQRTGPT